MERWKTLDRRRRAAFVVYASLWMVICAIQPAIVQGEASQLSPAFPSWDRVIEELRQATLQQRAGLADDASLEQQLPALTPASVQAAPSLVDDYYLTEDDTSTEPTRVSVMGSAGTAVDAGYEEDVDDDSASSYSSTAGTSTASVTSDAPVMNDAEGEEETEEELFDVAAAADAERPVVHAEAEREVQTQQPAEKQQLVKQQVVKQQQRQQRQQGQAQKQKREQGQAQEQKQEQEQEVEAPLTQPRQLVSHKKQQGLPLALQQQEQQEEQQQQEEAGAEEQPAEEAVKPAQSLDLPAEAFPELSDAAAADETMASTEAADVALPPAAAPQLPAQPHTTQQQPEQLPPAKLAKGAFPAAYLSRPKVGVAKVSSSSSSSSSSSTDENPVQASLQGVSAITDTDSFKALPQLPKFRGFMGAAKDHPAQQGGSSSSADSSSSSSNAAASSGSAQQVGARVRLLPPNNFPGLTGPSQQQQQQQQQQQDTPQKRSDAALSGPTAEEAKKADESDQKLAGQKILPREPLHISPPPTLTSVTAIDIDHALLQIPSSFMGISHEWNHVGDMNAAPGYKAALRLLGSYGTGPFLVRVGGGSTDATKDVLPHTVYTALRQVYKETGARYILGLNFEDVNLKLTQAQVKRARANLPEDSLVTFELGNEPNFYGRKKNMTALEYSRCCFTTEWTDFARNLSCPCGTDQCCVENQFAGPVWGHINVYPSTFKWFLDNAARYVSLVTVHWYKATKETPNTPHSLLDEGPIRVEMDNLRQLVQVANSFGKPLRVAEMNTISNSGRLGVSNVFAAALWTLDGAFEVAAAGAVGVNLHQGAGQNLYSAMLRRVEGSKLKPVVLRPPFYGMLMFQQAVRGGAILLGKQQLSTDTGYIKVWPLMDTSNGELRFVLINKHPKQAATQVLRLPASSSSSYQSIAHLSRLVAQGDDPLSATSGITLGGHYYSAGCVEQGRDQTLLLEADGGPSNQPTWSIYLPPGSATLVRIPTAAKTV